MRKSIIDYETIDLSKQNEPHGMDKMRNYHVMTEGNIMPTLTHLKSISQIQPFKYDQLHPTIIGIFKSVLRHINSLAEGWQDGHQLYRDASRRWPLVDL